jgi:general stress protein 26
MATPEELKEKLWDSLRAQRTVMLALAGVEESHARPMTAMFEHDGPPVWFFTSTDNALARSQADQQRAVATFAAKGHDLFATLHGRLVPESDRGALDRLWNRMVAAWYEGKDDPRLALLRFEPDSAEIWLNDASVFTGVKILLGEDPRKSYAGKVASVRLQS